MKQSPAPPPDRRAPATGEALGASPLPLQAALETLPAPFEPLDVSAVDGFLCGVLLQPRPVPADRWLALIGDGEARPLPPALAGGPWRALALQRHALLERAIAGRQWFDPWVFEPEEADDASQAVAPWVAGFALAAEVFPALMSLDSPALIEPLALLYRHFDPDDLEDADDLLDAIADLGPPADLSEAVEDLVRATLLLADVSRPIPAPGDRTPARPVRRPRPSPPRGPAGARRRSRSRLPADARR